MGDYVYIGYEELKRTFKDILESHKVDAKEADEIAAVFTENARDGVISHSVSRFPLMIDYVDRSVIRPGVKPTLVSSFAAVEKWDAGRGFGIITAKHCMKRAIELASRFGIGLVVSYNANHWMRPGYYGHMAADMGYVGICWTTTKRNLVPWGASEPAIGNNPLVIAVPRKKGNIVFDSSMAQYSWGQINEYAADGRNLPTLGGYDQDGELTDDPKKILETFKAMSAGFWKGTAMSIILESTACTLAQSSTVMDNNVYGTTETNMTQIYMAMDPRCINENFSDETADKIVANLKAQGVRYPGEKALKHREISKEKGIQIPKRAWEKLRSLSPKQ